MIAAAAPTFNTATDNTDTAITTSGTYPQGDVVQSKYGIASKLVASTSYTLGRIELRLNKIGSPVYNLYVQICADNGVGAPGAIIGSASSPVPASGLGTDTLISFNPLATGLVSGTTYWVVLFGDNATLGNIVAPRTVSDITVTAASPTITSAGAANFTSNDVGASFTGSRVSTSATIISVTSATVATLSVNASTSGSTGTTTIGGANTAHNVTWAYHTPSTGNSTFRSQDGTTWVSVNTSRMHKYITYR